MTLEQLEQAIAQLRLQVEANTTAITNLNAKLDEYATKTQLSSTQSTISANTSDIVALGKKVTELQTSIGLVNKISKLLDVNADTPTKGDILQYDGDRWTNIAATNIGTGGSGVSTLEQLLDVKITNKTNGQALAWNNSESKWVNTTISSGGGGSSSFNEEAMWKALEGNTPRYINTVHIKDALTITGLTVNGISNLNGAVNATGNILGTKEITAYA